MRLDHQSAVSDLRQSVELLHAEPTSAGDFSARLYDFTTTLFTHPLCAQALEAALDERGPESDILQRNCVKVVGEIVPDLATLCRWVADLDQHLIANPPKLSGNHDTLKQARKDLDSEWPLANVRKPVRAWLADISSADRLAPLGFDAVIDLQRLLDQVSSVHRSLRRAAGAAAEPKQDALVEKLRQLLAGHCRDLTFAEELLRASNLRPLVADLRDIHKTLSSVLDGTGFPAASEAMLNRYRSWGDGAFTSLRANASRIATIVEARLHRGAVQHHSIQRLRAFLEHFGKPALLADFDDEERIHPGNRRFEDRLQQHVDRFLFLEGFFPFTHNEASGGAIDSFLTRNEVLFRGVTSTHQIPILLELKVHLRSDTKAADVNRKIGEALEQLQIYSSHFQGSATWRTHELTAFVAYDGPKRFSTSKERVVLCYLGDASPSDGSTSLD
ncbi:MAG: hypothetical protein AB7O24_17945 [Kofleriaceae bacterium]